MRNKTFSQNLISICKVRRLAHLVKEAGHSLSVSGFLLRIFSTRSRSSITVVDMSFGITSRTLDRITPSNDMGSTFKSRFLRSTGIHSSKTRVHISISCSYTFFKADHLQYEFYLFVVWQFKISLRFLYLYSTTSLNAFRGLFGGASFAAPTATIPVSWLSVPINSISSL